jgi:2-phospho-L-lactate guanylyltransferase
MKLRIAAVVPIRSFRESKTRLEPALDLDQRERLMRTMATNVLRAVAQSRSVEVILLVSPADEVLTWAAGLPWPVVPVDQSEGSSGLDAAVELGRDRASSLGADAMLSLFADLPFVTSEDVKEFVDRPSDVVLGPDRSSSGTNALFLRLKSQTGDFRFAYGPNSLARHISEAHRIGSSPTVRHVPGIAFDLDTPGDWDDVLIRPLAERSSLGGMIEAKVSST